MNDKPLVFLEIEVKVISETAKKKVGVGGFPGLSLIRLPW